jgi:hypothetical protein
MISVLFVVIRLVIRLVVRLVVRTSVGDDAPRRARGAAVRDLATRLSRGAAISDLAARVASYGARITPANNDCTSIAAGSQDLAGMCAGDSTRIAAAYTDGARV